MNSDTKKLIEMALNEDVGSGDISTDAIVSGNLHAIARIISKQKLILSGIDVAKYIFDEVDKDIVFDAKDKDGAACGVGDIIAIVQGKAKSLLKAERTVLNFLQKLSGVATVTNRFVEEIKGTKARLLDTRKTTPGMRALEKEAVKHGGGTNHRMGLFDQYLIKNNHIAVAGSVKEALKAATKARRPGHLIEIEIRLLDEIEPAIAGGADMIMLDNMTVENVKRAVALIKGRVKIEASGNILLDTIKAYANTGVDFISVGQITHSAPAVDIHMNMMIERSPGELSISSIDKTPHK